MIGESQYILTLDVAVEDALVMQLSEPGQSLEQYAPHFVLCKRLVCPLSLLDFSVQVSQFCELCDDVQLSVLDERLVIREYVGMKYGCQNSNFV